MYPPTSTAGRPIIKPLLQTENTSPAVARENWEQLCYAVDTAGECNGIVALPVGNIYVDSPTEALISLNESHTAININGAGVGKTALVPLSNSQTIVFASTLVDYLSAGTFATGQNTITSVPNTAEYEQGDVVYFWKFNSSTTRSVRQRVEVFTSLPTSVVLNDVISSGPPVPDSFKHVKGVVVEATGGPNLPIPAGTTTVRVNSLNLNAINRFVAGDDVLLGDGPGINEFFGEWLTVAAVDAEFNLVTFTTPTVREYAIQKACLVPGRSVFGGARQHMSDIIVEDLIIMAPVLAQHPEPFGIVRAGVRIHFKNVAWIGRPGLDTVPFPLILNFATCGMVDLVGNRMIGSLGIAICQNMVVHDVVTESIRISEFARECRLVTVETTGFGGMTLAGDAIARIDVYNSVFRHFGAVDGIANIQFAADSVVCGIQICQPRDANSVVRIDAPRVQLLAVNSALPVTHGSGASGVRCGGGPGGTTLAVRADGAQTANLAEFQLVGGTTVVRIGPTGWLGTVRTSDPLASELVENELTHWADVSGDPPQAVTSVRIKNVVLSARQNLT